MSKFDESELKSTIQDFVETFLTYEEPTESGSPILYEYRPKQFIRRVCLYKDAHNRKEYIITFEMVQQPKDGTEDYKCIMDLLGLLEDALPGSFYEEVLFLVGKWVPLIIWPGEEFPTDFVLEDKRVVLFSHLESEESKNEVPAFDISQIVIELENEDQVKIRIPGEQTWRTETFRNLGFKNSTTKEARVFKMILETGEYIQKTPADRKIVGEIDKKLKKYFGETEKFMSSGAIGSGRHIPVFNGKRQAPVANFERKLEHALKSGNEDLLQETILIGIESGKISKEQAEQASNDFKEKISQQNSVFDTSELLENGSFHEE